MRRGGHVQCVHGCILDHQFVDGALDHPAVQALVLDPLETTAANCKGQGERERGERWVSEVNV